MKKGLKIFLAIAIPVILLIVVGLTLLVTTLFKEKTPITGEEFKNTMTAKGYGVADALAQFSEYPYVKKAYIAINLERTYQIEFYELENEDYAIDFYKNNKAQIEKNKSSSAVQTNNSVNNHSKYTLSSNGKYGVVSRVGNTVIYLRVEDTYRDIVKDILKSIDY